MFSASKHSSAFFVFLALALVFVCAQLADASPGVRSISINSSPVGAEVYAITGKLGRTPVLITTRDIYPNSYPPEKHDLYGTVILRKEGCKEFIKRLTIGDIEQGLKVKLECQHNGSATRTSLENQETRQKTGVTPAEHRLRQLRVLQELLDEGILSQKEEEKIRRRILAAD